MIERSVIRRTEENIFIFERHMNPAAKEYRSYVIGHGLRELHLEYTGTP